MHELSIAMEIHEVCRARIPAGTPARIERVKVAVGELSTVEPELLVFAWEAATAGGPDAGAALEVEWHPARQVCDACGEAAERDASSWLSICTRCGQPLRVEGGQELDVLQFSYEVSEEGATAQPAGRTPGPAEA